MLQAQTFRISSIHLTGNKRTLDFVILRHLDVAAGDTLPMTELLPMLHRNRAHLLRTSLFNDVTITTSRLVGDSLQLSIEVTERWYLLPYPHFELSDRNFNEWWTTYDRDISRIVLGATVYWNNIRGRDERLKVTMLTGFNQELGLRYTMPFVTPTSIFGLEAEVRWWASRQIPARTAANRLQFLMDDEHLRQTYQARFSLLLQHRVNLRSRISLEWQQESVADTIQRLNPDWLPTRGTGASWVGAGMELRYDNTDQIAYPMMGWRLKGLLAYRNGFGDSPWHLYTMHTQIAYYQRTGRRSSAGARLLMQANLGDNGAYLWQQAIGYWPAIVRGHELDVVDGQQMLVIQAEWKRRLWQRQIRWTFLPVPGFNDMPVAIFLRPFVDVGRTSDLVFAGTNPLNDRWIAGFGLGFDVVTYYDYALSVNLSRNGQGENGVYLHVNF